jgi:tryptophan-rich sensory protein
VGRTAITLFFLQLVLNAAWSPFFFGLHHAGERW